MPYTFGEINQEELSMNIYEKDTTANAVVLYEHGNTTVENIDGDVFMKTTIYRKIKILTNDGKDHAIVKIYIYNDKEKTKEKVKKIKAITYNLNESNTHLNKNNVFTKTINDNWKEVTFTFPNVKGGSVLEYQYDLESKFFFNFKGWTFQSDIPKIYSEYHASIPGNWNYNRHLIGNLRLYKNEATVKKTCLKFKSGASADCEVLTYSIKDIPAFIEEEFYNTSSSNYISKIKFELAKITNTNGETTEYTTTWGKADKKIKYDESIGKQLNNKSYFTKILPPNILEIDDEMTKSEDIFKLIQNHYSLNTEKVYIFKDVDVKKAYKESFGSVSEINLSLINALQAAGIDAKIFLSSTRKNGFPTKIHPILTDFNYLTAYVTINNKKYILDASDKYLSFGMLPYKALNKYGRVIDFEKGSFWYDINPISINTNRKDCSLKMDDDGFLKGTINDVSKGYYANFIRKKIGSDKLETYISNIETKNENVEIIDYTNNNLEDLTKPLEEVFEVNIQALDIVGNKIYLNPFIDKYTKNPFQLEQRNYPVDFGFKNNETFTSQIEIPNNYKIISAPKKISFKLPNKGGLFIANISSKNNIITVFSKIILSKTVYDPVEYKYLKKFFNQIINFQNSFIILEQI